MTNLHDNITPLSIVELAAKKVGDQAAIIHTITISKES